MAAACGGGIDLTTLPLGEACGDLVCVEPWDYRGEESGSLKRRMACYVVTTQGGLRLVLDLQIKEADQRMNDETATERSVELEATDKNGPVLRVVTASTWKRGDTSGTRPLRSVRYRWNKASSAFRPQD